MFRQVFLSIAGLLMLCGAAWADEVKSQTRKMEPFDAIEMRGAAKVDIVIGSPQSVVLEADSDVLTHVSTEVHGTTLVIERKDYWWTNWNQKRLQVRIKLPKLVSYALEGTAETSVSGLDGGTTTFAINGTGNVKASGKLDKLSISLNGTGSADLSNLPVGEASVDVNGTGSVRVTPAHALRASVNGVGSVIYEGSPEKVSTSVNGVGSIRQAR